MQEFLSVLNALIIDTKIGVIIKKVHLLEHIKMVTCARMVSPFLHMWPTLHNAGSSLNSCCRFHARHMSYKHCTSTTGFVCMWIFS
jgi:hypothetical protein